MSDKFLQVLILFLIGYSVGAVIALIHNHVRRK